ncbi:MAG TPA: ATP-dependent protease LonB [Candidatus Bilamarchaeum sp.]|nr:ATP-dependent protease LonB [Candidatus Bilamarchaeum sp.]
MKYKSTADVPVPEKMIDQIIGQDKAVDIVKKAARQKRNVLLIGPPGTGKSMMAQAMAELMQSEQLEDVLVYPNPNNENQPLVRITKTHPDYAYIVRNRLQRYFSPKELEKIKKAGEEKAPEAAKAVRNGLGRRISSFQQPREDRKGPPATMVIAVIALVLIAIVLTNEIPENMKLLLVAIAFGIGFLYIISTATAGLGKRLMVSEQLGPKLIVDNSERSTAPFIDATSSRAGSLLGDIKHDPLQSGGLGTPPHLRVEAGAIHQANKGVLFIDEIASMKLNWQQEILTAMQEKKYPITGQSEMSSGALVKTQPVPTDFVLVAAGNLQDVAAIHPALRSRIRGGGYEVYVEDSMDDTPENEDMIVQFVAQEIKRDGKIPHFASDAVAEIIEEARKMSGRRKKFTLNLRELGGLVRAAGDIAREKNLPLVTRAEVMEAKKVFKSIESQLGAKIIEHKKEYQTLVTTGAETGRVNGLAVLGDSRAGLVLPIVAEATPAASRSEGRVIATGKLGQIAKEAVDNVSAIFKKYIGTAIARTDLHIQFLQTYEGVEGDSASISTAVAVISAVASIPVHQSVAMTGSLDVRGRVLPVGGISGKLEAAIDAGIKKALIPKANAQDVYLSKDRRQMIEIVEVTDIVEVLEHALQNGPKKKELLRKMKLQAD